MLRSFILSLSYMAIIFAPIRNEVIFSFFVLFEPIHLAVVSYGRIKNFQDNGFERCKKFIHLSVTIFPYFIETSFSQLEVFFLATI